MKSDPPRVHQIEDPGRVLGGESAREIGAECGWLVHEPIVPACWGCVNVELPHGPLRGNEIEPWARSARVQPRSRDLPRVGALGPITKLDIVKYYVAVEDGIMRALERRPTTLERWPKGVHQGIVLSTARRAAATPSSRSAFPQGAPDYLETARIEFPSGRHADECARRSSPWSAWRPRWADYVPSLAGAGDDVDHPDELRLDLDPQPGTDFADAVRVAAEARVLLERARLRRLPEDLGRPRRAHLRTDRATLDVHGRPSRRDRLRARARAAAARSGDDQLVEGGARPADLHRLQPERVRPHHRLRLQRSTQARRAGLGTVTWDELAEIAPEDFTVATMPPASPRSADRHAGIDDTAHRCSRCWTCTSATKPREGRHALPARLSEDARRTKARTALVATVTVR